MQYSIDVISVFNRFGGGDESLDPHKCVTYKKRQAALPSTYSLLCSYTLSSERTRRFCPAIEFSSFMTKCHVRMRRNPKFSRHAAHSFAGQSTYTFLTFMKHTHRYQISRKSTHESKYKYIIQTINW